MRADRLQVKRRPEKVISNDRRVITRFFMPGDEGRGRSILKRLLALSETEVADVLSEVLQNVVGRHKDIGAVFLNHYAKVVHLIENGGDLSHERRLLIGSYFTMEYSIESAALFNPSIVPHPDTSDVPPAARASSSASARRARGTSRPSSFAAA